MLIKYLTPYRINQKEDPVTRGIKQVFIYKYTPRQLCIEPKNFINQKTVSEINSVPLYSMALHYFTS